MSSGIDMKVERNLLDSNFEGYKLSLDSVPCYKTEYASKLHSKTLSDEQFSFCHAKLFASNNVLIQDEKITDKNGVYILDGQKINFIDRSEDTSIQLHEVWNSDCVNDSSEDSYNSSLSFPSSDLAVFADGYGTLYILDTKNREERSLQSWTSLYKNEICGPKRPFVICSSMMSGEVSLHILIHYIEETSKIETLKKGIVEKAQYANVVEWINFTVKDKHQVDLERVRRYVVHMFTFKI